MTVLQSQTDEWPIGVRPYKSLGKRNFNPYFSQMHYRQWQDEAPRDESQGDSADDYEHDFAGNNRCFWREPRRCPFKSRRATMACGAPSRSSDLNGQGRPPLQGGEGLNVV